MKREFVLQLHQLNRLAAGITAAFLFAASAFVISDIRVEGLTRTEPGTVFSHLPFRAGEDYTAEKGVRAIHSLYQSGLFRDVTLSQDGDVIVVRVMERPAVATIETHGIKAFDKEAVEKSLRDVGMAEGRIFDHAILERADQELRRQYLARGYYGVKIKTIATPLERNRVRITINVDEGRASSIASIRFTGNSLFDSDDLLDLMQLGTPNWFSWYTKRDLYSREKLAADLETIRSFYMNQGYLDFRIDSVQVSIAPNKSDVYITINLTEGEKYTIRSAKLQGDMLGLDDQLNALVTLKEGDIYNAQAVKDVSTAITDKLSTLGYAFASANPNPISDPEKRTVDIVYTIDPGRRAYVRRVNITGNNRTRDEVIRREVRQYEAAWFDSDKVKLSRDRIDRLGYFETVTAEPKPVPGTRDQVDLEVNVKERPTGSISLGAGYSTSEGIILSAGFAQNNVFGTGNSVSVDVNTSKSQRTYALSVVEPYVTPEGVSRSYEIYDRRVDLEELDVERREKGSEHRLCSDRDPKFRAGLLQGPQGVRQHRHVAHRRGPEHQQVLRTSVLRTATCPHRARDSATDRCTSSSACRSSCTCGPPRCPRSAPRSPSTDRPAARAACRACGRMRRGAPARHPYARSPDACGRSSRPESTDGLWPTPGSRC